MSLARDYEADGNYCDSLEMCNIIKDIIVERLRDSQSIISCIQPSDIITPILYSQTPGLGMIMVDVKERC